MAISNIVEIVRVTPGTLSIFGLDNGLDMPIMNVCLISALGKVFHSRLVSPRRSQVVAATIHLKQEVCQSS